MSLARYNGVTAPPEPTAAGWYTRIRLGRPSAEDHQAFEAWLAQDPAHAREYDEYTKLWDLLGAQGSDPRIGALRRDLLVSTVSRRLRRGRWRAVGFAAVVMLAALVAGFMINAEEPLRARLPGWLGGPEAFATAVGEHSTIPLQDGSTVVLDTSSKIQLSFTPVERAVRLIRGQALFEVAKNPSRPFVVYAGDRRIVALGTSFDVRLQDASVRVTLVEGRVAVDRVSAPAFSRPTELTPGQQLIASPSSPVEVHHADMASVTSWREGRLMFSDEPLAAAVAEVNRYSRTKIVLADPALASLRISGVFRTGQITGFVAALETRFPLQIRRQSDHTIMLNAPPAAVQY